MPSATCSTLCNTLAFRTQRCSSARRPGASPPVPGRMGLRTSAAVAQQSDMHSMPSEHALYYEYTSAVDPLTSKIISPVPIKAFGHELIAKEQSQVVALDIRSDLDVDVAATSPNLLAHFVRVLPGESLTVDEAACSELYFVYRGSGKVEHDGGTFQYGERDFFTMPSGTTAIHADQDTAMYYINDAPLLAQLGAQPGPPRFKPLLFVADKTRHELLEVMHRPGAGSANRVNVILNDDTFARTRSLTPVLWSVFASLPKDAEQPPHRHQSVALDTVVDCQPGCYTLLGWDVDRAAKKILDPIRVDWAPGTVFITPPGMWHGHYNESGADATLIAVQDAGLHNYMRSLNIIFT